MTTALELYDAALDADARLDYVLAGEVLQAGLARWTSASTPGDGGMLDRCGAPTLDIGCGPGRLVAALAGRGVSALGLDISPVAVRLTRARGGRAVRGDVFRRVPREGRWATALLADGNIGIGGDPVRLLARCRELLAPGGAVVVELETPGVATAVAELRLRVDARVSAPFPWAFVSFADVPGLAYRAGLGITEAWTEAGRWFAALNRDSGT